MVKCCRNPIVEGSGFTVCSLWLVRGMGAQLGDFGVAHRFTSRPGAMSAVCSHDWLQTTEGTIMFMPPESCTGEVMGWWLERVTGVGSSIKWWSGSLLRLVRTLPARVSCRTSVVDVAAMVVGTGRCWLSRVVLGDSFIVSTSESATELVEANKEVGVVVWAQHDRPMRTCSCLARPAAQHTLAPHCRHHNDDFPVNRSCHGSLRH